MIRQILTELTKERKLQDFLPKARLHNTSKLAASASNFATPSFFARMNPQLVAMYLRFFLMAVALIYSLKLCLAYFQLPTPEKTKDRQTTLYFSLGQTPLGQLFGTSTYSVNTPILKGIISTVTDPNSPSRGFAIFQLDGRPSGVISQGESLGNGMVLESIHDDHVVLIYQGKKQQIMVEKSKSSPNPKPPLSK
jgi:hypothetical protein